MKLRKPVFIVFFFGENIIRIYVSCISMSIHVLSSFTLKFCKIYNIIYPLYTYTYSRLFKSYKTVTYIYFIKHSRFHWFYFVWFFFYFLIRMLLLADADGKFAGYSNNILELILRARIFVVICNFLCSRLWFNNTIHCFLDLHISSHKLQQMSVYDLFTRAIRGIYYRGRN